MTDLEHQIGDMLADGRITDEDADAVRRFSEFLRHAGPPAKRGEPIEIAPLDRLLAAGRKDLIADALGVDEANVDDEIDRIMDERRRARERPNIPMTGMAEIRCERGCDVHLTKTAIVELFHSPYHDLAPIPEDLWDVFFITIWDVESQGDADGYCPAADAVSRCIEERRIWEPSETVVMLRCFDEVKARSLDAMFIDIGAQIGYYSVLADRADLDFRSIEADWDVCKGPLTRNLFNSGVNPWNIRVGPAVDLSTFTNQRDYVVKIDVEGAEADAVSALGHLWNGEIKYALIEISPMFGPGYQDLVVNLLNRGYRAFQMPPKNDPPYPLDEIRRDLLPWEIHGSEREVRMVVGNIRQANVLFVHSSMGWPLWN